MKLFLNRAELSLNSVNSGILEITEAWTGLNLKILSLHVSCWCCGSILVSHKRGDCVAGSSHFTVMTNIFVTEFREFIWEKLKMLHNENICSLLRLINLHLSDGSKILFLNFFPKINIKNEKNTLQCYVVIIVSLKYLKENIWSGRKSGT